jgi:hypothetical protein
MVVANGFGLAATNQAVAINKRDAFRFIMDFLGITSSRHWHQLIAGQDDAPYLSMAGSQHHACP